MDIPKLSELALEVALLMGVPPVMDLPAVEVVSPAQIQQVCGRRAKACYQRPKIYLEEEPETTYQHSILLHELVHHSQEMLGIGGTKWTCQRFIDREFQAYQVQQEWLRQKGSAVFLIIPRWSCNENSK